MSLYDSFVAILSNEPENCRSVMQTDRRFTCRCEDMGSSCIWGLTLDAGPGGFGAYHVEVYFLVSPEGWGVVANNDQLGLPGTQTPQCLSVPEYIFPGLHHQGQARVDALNGLFL